MIWATRQRATLPGGPALAVRSARLGSPWGTWRDYASPEPCHGPCDLRLYPVRQGPTVIGIDAGQGNGMAGIEGEIIIARPVDVVFDYVADQSNEPQYNPQMVRAEKITAGPVGKGTRFHSAVASMGRTAEMLIECTGYDRPKLFATTTTMRQADISYTLRFDPAGGGTRMRWAGEVRPKGAFRLLGPLITWLGSRQEQRIWASLKQHLEQA